ncbi:hypothetical protein M378DRAFT_165120 [Amanita muscaria Koide BX008]|uniref:Uncharacterized protein n=1 Tax=Amanita muscaria (strain Koide BX008) TaxID=946122 RepID=A0A0C2T899_AMAMK|nr:hypothetical protein M378DRAFT_165120 [Amanita muscaria Koide BX008]
MPNVLYPDDVGGSVQNQRTIFSCASRKMSINPSPTIWPGGLTDHSASSIKPIPSYSSSSL